MQYIMYGYCSKNFFCFLQHTNDFPLYTEAIKFFNNSESMVRIAVRTLTLNVYRVDDKSMLQFIRDKTAAPYFSNLVWFIGNHVLEIDAAVKKVAEDSGASGGTRGLVTTEVKKAKYYEVIDMTVHFIEMTT